MLNLRKLLIGAAAASLIAGGAHATELLVNGGFEDFSVGGAGYYNIGVDHPTPAGFGWTVSGDVDLVTYGAGYTTTTPAGGGGTQALDMVGYNDGVISQSFATVVGQTYNFSFDYSHNPGVTAGNMGFLILGNSSLANDTIFDNDLAQTWTHYVGSFVADSTSTLISFNSYDTCCSGGIFLDNVSVSTGGAVPEPATWALMITGFGLVGSTLRRRRAIAA